MKKSKKLLLFILCTCLIILTSGCLEKRIGNGYPTISDSPGQVSEAVVLSPTSIAFAESKPTANESPTPTSSDLPGLPVSITPTEPPFSSTINEGDMPTNTPAPTMPQNVTSIPSPTQLPTPTHAPIDSPTSTPIETPPVTPTLIPTGTPTIIPTNVPTPMVTLTPENTPTPSPIPTSSPTPTNKPTQIVENHQTLTPTDEPFPLGERRLIQYKSDPNVPISISSGLTPTSYYVGERVELPVLENYIEWEFIGWREQGTNEIRTCILPTECDSYTLVATWREKHPIVYWITHPAGGNWLRESSATLMQQYGMPQEFYADTGVKLNPYPSSVKYGTFMGWADGRYYPEIRIITEIPPGTNQAMNLIAIWGGQKTITYITGDTTQTDTFIPGGDKYLLRLTDSEKTFVGWKVIDADNTSAFTKLPTSITEDIVLYPVWRCSLQANDASGNIVFFQSTFSGMTVSLPKVSKYTDTDGNPCNKWKDNQGNLYDEYASFEVTHNTVLTAFFQP